MIGGRQKMNKVMDFVKKQIVLLLAILFYVFLMLSHRYLDLDHTIQLVIALLLHGSFPFLIFMSMVYGVVAFRKDNFLTPLVPAVVMYAIYKDAVYHVKGFAVESEDVVTILIIFIIAVFIRLAVSLWKRKRDKRF